MVNSDAVKSPPVGETAGSVRSLFTCSNRFRSSTARPCERASDRSKSAATAWQRLSIARGRSALRTDSRPMVRSPPAPRLRLAQADRIESATAWAVCSASRVENVTFSESDARAGIERHESQRLLLMRQHLQYREDFDPEDLADSPRRHAATQAR